MTHSAFKRESHPKYFQHQVKRLLRLISKRPCLLHQDNVKLYSAHVSIATLQEEDKQLESFVKHKLNKPKREKEGCK